MALNLISRPPCFLQFSPISQSLIFIVITMKYKKSKHVLYIFVISCFILVLKVILSQNWYFLGVSPPDRSKPFSLYQLCDYIINFPSSSKAIPYIDSVINFFVRCTGFEFFFLSVSKALSF